MYSIKSVQYSSFSTSNKIFNEKISLKIIEKRLNHLRKELKNLTKQKIIYSTNNLLLTEQQINDNDEYYIQYNKRLNQLLRLYNKQVNNLHLWHYYQSDRIEQMYAYELRQSNERFQTKKIDFKLKLLSIFNDKRRYLDFEHQNINIHCRYFSNNDQFILNRTNNINDIIPFDGHNHHSNESTQQRPTYNLRRAVVNDLISENSSTPTTSSSSLEDLSIFSRSNSLLPPFGGIELQCCLSNIDIEQDIKDVQNNLCNNKSNIEKDLSKNKIDDISTKSLIDVYIEEGRLWYQRSWFSRNSPILLVFDDLEIIPALILTVGRNDLLIRRVGTNIKHRISLSLLHDGHLAIRKRNCIF